MRFSIGILVSKWKIFLRSIDVSHEFADKITKTSSVPHNYVPVMVLPTVYRD